MHSIETRFVHMKKSVTKRPRSEDEAAVAAVRQTHTSSIATPSKGSPSTSQRRLPPALIVVGTYHSVMAGLALRSAGQVGGVTPGAPQVASKFLLKFSIKHHVGCVTGVAVCDRYIASCGTDERLFLFTVKDRGGQVADLGSLAPASEVRTLAFQGNQHLICGCLDGTVSVYRTRDWESILAVQVHEKSVQSLALHPNGALCVTVGSDRFVAMLDMTTGKLITKLKLSASPAAGVPSQILFSSDATAELFAVVMPFEVTVFETRTGAVRGKISIDKKPPNEIHSACFIDLDGLGTMILLGTESGRIYAVPCKSSSLDAAAPLEVNLSSHRCAFVGVPAEIVTAQASIKDEAKKKYPTHHATRVKTLSLLPGTTDVLVSTDTNGAIVASRVVPSDGRVELSYQTSANCQGRVTSLTGLSR